MSHGRLTAVLTIGRQRGLGRCGNSNGDGIRRSTKKQLINLAMATHTELGNQRSSSSMDLLQITDTSPTGPDGTGRGTNRGRNNPHGNRHGTRVPLWMEAPTPGEVTLPTP